MLSHRWVSTRPFAWWIQWWWVDPVIAALTVGILRESLRTGTGADILGQLNLADRRSNYANMLQLAAIFAAFSGAGLLIYLGFTSRRVEHIRAQAGIALLRVWLAALVTPWLCALILVFCGITDRGGKDSSNATRWVALAALLVVVLQIARVIWILYQLAVTEFSSANDAASTSRPVRIIRRQSPK